MVTLPAAPPYTPGNNLSWRCVTLHTSAAFLSAPEWQLLTPAFEWMASLWLALICNLSFAFSARTLWLPFETCSGLGSTKRSVRIPQFFLVQPPLQQKTMSLSAACILFIKTSADTSSYWVTFRLLSVLSLQLTFDLDLLILNGYFQLQCVHFKHLSASSIYILPTSTPFIGQSL